MRTSLALACLAIGSALAAPVASAATQLGQLDPAANPSASCVGMSLWVQSAATDAPGYAVPAGGGVITSWSHKAHGAVGRELALKVLRPQGGTSYTVIGGDPFRILTPSVVNTFDTRIPVEAGDLLSLRVGNPPSGGPFDFGGGASCAFPAAAGNTMHQGASPSDPAPGSTQALGNSYTLYRLNVTANVEPDADDDGYGDETQDACPANTSTHGACPSTSDPSPGPANPGPPLIGPVADTTRPGLTIRRRARRSIRAIALSLRATEDATAQVRGTIAIGRRSRAFRLKLVTTALEANVARSVTLKLSRKARRAVARALKSGKPVRVTLSLAAVDGSENTRLVQRTVSLRG